MRAVGWIIDLYQKRNEMVVWLKKPDGTSLRLVDKWNPAIHVCGEFSELLELACQPFLTKCCFVKKFEYPGDAAKSLSQKSLIS